VPWLGLVVSTAVLVIVSTLWWKEASERRTLHAETVPEIRALMASDLTTAWRHTRDVMERAPRDPVLQQLWLDLTLPVSLTSEPEGAMVETRGYRELGEDWINLGVTPIDDARLPIAPMRFRVSREGYRTIETAPSILPAARPFILHPEDDAPEGMVYVEAGPVTYMLESRDLPGFWIDRLEVTNAQFRQFIDDGGYQRPELWRHPAIDQGRELAWEELMARLVDSTGLPGPSTWSKGTYPDGRGDHPVDGVSWYEAAAYAEYVGKQLPTVFHWYRAAGLGTPQLQQFSDILMMSNFNSSGTVPAGSLDGLGHSGTLDMAGNVAEWCLNPDGDQRHILGGSWMETHYRFRDPEAWPPLERRPGFGFRLMQASDSLTDELVANISFPDRDLGDPVEEELFAIYARQFNYDRIPLNAQVDEIDESHRDWRREWISFDNAYGDDRVIAQILVPRHVQPPYQAVIYFPAGDAVLLDSSRQAGLSHVEFFVRSGRVVIYPVVRGTFERKQPAGTGPQGCPKPARLSGHRHAPHSGLPSDPPGHRPRSHHALQHQLWRDTGTLSAGRGATLRGRDRGIRGNDRRRTLPRGNALAGLPGTRHPAHAARQRQA
jgi:hypothetical protein